MTDSQAVAAGAAPVNIVSTTIITVRDPWTLQWQPDDGKSVLSLGEFPVAPNTNADALRIAPDQTIEVTPSPRDGVYVWSQAAGTVVVNSA